MHIRFGWAGLLYACAETVTITASLLKISESTHLEKNFICVYFLGSFEFVHIVPEQGASVRHKKVKFLQIVLELTRQLRHILAQALSPP